MKISLDVQTRINKAQSLFFNLSKLLFRNIDISIDIRRRVYVATVINILLWGCEAWALKVEDRRRLEVFHMRCCRRMMNVSIFDVIANHELTNLNILRELGMLKLEAYLELRRARWLEKLSHMNHTRAPRLLLGSWLPHSRRNGLAGRSQNTI